MGGEGIADLSNEITQYVNCKLPVKVDGIEVNISNINNACTLLEESTYMRDFDTENNRIVGINFNVVNCESNSFSKK